MARTLADVAVKPHVSKTELKIFDPACGSGIFLCEALRALQRQRFQGPIHLVGYDVSSSAVEMAKFALKHSDLPTNSTVSVETRDFLSVEQPLDADIILMNPPFMAFQDLDAERRALLQRSLSGFRYRPDFSALFAAHALTHLKEGGTLATLLPAGLLSQTSAAGWRHQILTTTSLELVAVLGDHGLFRDAMVNIAALVIQKNTMRQPSTPTTLWASQNSGASAAALRRLRRWSDGDTRPQATQDWSIYTTKEEHLLVRDEWLPRPNNLGELPQSLTLKTGIVRADDLFNVELGIRVGDRKTYIIDAALYLALPKKEQGVFRPIAEKSAIRSAD